MNDYRMIYLTACALCVGALLISVLFMEEYLGLEPCPLCVVSRGIVAVLAVVFLLIATFSAGVLWQRVYGGLSVLLIALGIAVSARHIGLQNLPPELVPGCTPDMSYLFAQFPLLDAFETILSSGGECAEVSWTALGLTIPEQTLVFYIVLLAMVGFAFTKTLKPH